jgi:hypothetical protein
MSPLGKARLGCRNDSANIAILRRISTANGLLCLMTPESQAKRKVHRLAGQKNRCRTLIAQGIRAKRPQNYSY